MQRKSRRSILMAGAVTAGSVLLPRGWRPSIEALGATPSVRHNASSAEGKQMLKIYANAVGKMMALTETDPGNPLSWVYQWYTHGVKQPWQQPISQTFKQQEIDRIYTNAADPHRALATTMWDTCTHYGQPEGYFLPWHRMYVYYFERIIRSLSGDSSFTLPYWDYTNPAAHALPAEFMMPADPLFKSLFRSQRGAGVNNGQPIDGGGPNTFLNLQDMVFNSYLKPAGGAGGFCPNLDRNLHGNVHTHTGAQPPATDLGMTFVPTAANDPIFWLHHCNIDRIWASWNKAGGKNPNDSTFTGQPFTFADTSGNPITGKVADFLDTEPNYIYDVYLDRPPGSQPFPPAAAAPNLLALAVHANSAQTSGPVLLGAQPTSVPLAAQNAPEIQVPGGANNFAVKLNAALDTRQVYLSLNGVQANTEPGVSYDVYLDLPTGTKPDRAYPGYVGTINFFSAVAHGDHNHGADDRSVSLLATDAVKRLRQAGQLAATPTVTLAPNGSLVPGAQPKIDGIALISQ